MRALITGGAGLIGSHISDLLFENEYKVRILDNLEWETHRGKPDWINKKYEFIKGDVRNKKAVARALENVDYIFHQAAYGGFTPEISKYFSVNSIGTANIFEVIHEENLKIKKVVVASSQGIYGEGKYSCKKHGVIQPELRLLSQLQKRMWELNCPKCSSRLMPIATNEEKRADPGTVYSITKYTQERMATLAGQSIGVPTVVLRYAITYGPRQSIFNPYTGVVSIFSTRILNSLPPVVYEDGAQTRDFIFVEDVARANFLVSQKREADYQVFNVSSGNPLTILKLVDVLNKTYGTNVKPSLNGQFRSGDVRHLFLDNSKLTSLGWKPQITLTQGIKKYVKWIKTQGGIKEYFTEAQEIMKKNGVVMGVKR